MSQFPVSGHATHTWPNGMQYTGNWEQSLPQGQGVFVWPNGDKYTGSSQDGLPHGQGKMEYSNGDIHKGAFLCGKKEGRGVMRLANGEMFEGNWRNDKFDVVDAIEAAEAKAAAEAAAAEFKAAAAEALAADSTVHSGSASQLIFILAFRSLFPRATLTLRRCHATFSIPTPVIKAGTLSLFPLASTLATVAARTKLFPGLSTPNMPLMKRARPFLLWAAHAELSASTLDASTPWQFRSLPTSPEFPKPFLRLKTLPLGTRLCIGCRFDCL